MATTHKALWLASLAGFAAVGVSLAQERTEALAVPEASTPDVAELQADIERLNRIVPGQAVAMTQVAYNFSNLWFAAQAGNWPLAQFYFNETRVRLRWAMRIQPTRKLAAGEIDLVPLLERLESAQLAVVDEAVAQHDVARFESSYVAMLDACYGCHVASEKPFLKLRIPSVPAEPLIDFDPR
jgi:hypothetical protein